MFSRRTVLAGAAAALAGVGGCLDAPRRADCSERTRPLAAIDRRDPIERWVVGEPVPDPDPRYDPVAAVVLNVGPRRTVSLSVHDAGGPVLDRRVSLDDIDHVVVVFAEPRAWEMDVVWWPAGDRLSFTVDTFDCNARTHVAWMECDGRVAREVHATMASCPRHPTASTGRSD